LTVRELAKVTCADRGAGIIGREDGR